MTSDTPQTDEKKWCAYCGAWGDHQSGYCVPFLRDREVTLTHQLADARLEVERLKDQLNQRTEAAIADLKSESEARQRAEVEVERLGRLLFETRSLLTEFFDCVDIGGLHDGDCNISTEDPEKWDLGCNCTTAELRKKYIQLYSR